MEMTVVALVMLILVVLLGISVKLFDLKRKREEEAVAATGEDRRCLADGLDARGVAVDPDRPSSPVEGIAAHPGNQGRGAQPRAARGRGGRGEAGARSQPARLPHRGPHLGGSARPQPRGLASAFRGVPPPSLPGSPARLLLRAPASERAGAPSGRPRRNGLLSLNVIGARRRRARLQALEEHCRAHDAAARILVVGRGFDRRRAGARAGVSDEARGRTRCAGRESTTVAFRDQASPEGRGCRSRRSTNTTASPRRVWRQDDHRGRRRAGHWRPARRAGPSSRAQAQPLGTSVRLTRPRDSIAAVRSRGRARRARRASRAIPRSQRPPARTAGPSPGRPAASYCWAQPACGGAPWMASSQSPPRRAASRSSGLPRIALPEAAPRSGPPWPRHWSRARPRSSVTASEASPAAT